MNSHEKQNKKMGGHKKMMLEILYSKYFEKFVFFVRRVLNSNMFAEDIIQDIFTTIHQNDIRFMSEAAFVNYIYRSAYNACIDVVRHKQITQRYENVYMQEYEIKSKAENSEILYNELFSIVENRIDRLPSRCRLIFSMKYRDEQTNPEISEKIGLSQKTVENQVFIARNILRDYLRPYLCS